MQQATRLQYDQPPYLITYGWHPIRVIHLNVTRHSKMYFNI